MIDPYRLVRPLLHRLDAERAHRLSLAALRRGLVPPPPRRADPLLAVPLFGKVFPNPIGLAAGYDKNGEAIDALLALGFGFVEVGTVTPRPQAGNPRPRLFRLDADRAVINRMGFNNEGMEAVAGRLARRREAGRPGIVGANVGPNRDAVDPAADCAAAVRALAPFVDYVVVNVSSPNTPGLRDFERRADLARLLGRVLAARPDADPVTPLLVKVSPDTTEEARAAIAEVALEHRIDGLIATNTTTARPPGLIDRHRGETGGLSGRPLFPPSTAALADLAAATSGRMPLIGVGGIASPADAWAKIEAGASLVQLYTQLVFDGPWLVRRLNRGLARHLRQNRGGESLSAFLAARDAAAAGPGGAKAGTAP